MNKTEVIQQTKNAFDFLQKLYLESSYLIKEIEGILAEEVEEFVIGRGGGYGITSRSSNGLESINVSLWPLRVLSVFYVPKELTKYSGGTTRTAFSKGLKIIYLWIVLDEKDITEPYLNIGVIFNIVDKGKSPRFNKAEHLISHLAYHYTQAFTGDSSVEYEDGITKFKGEIIQVNLFDVNSSEEIRKLVTDPVLELFRVN